MKSDRFVGWQDLMPVSTMLSDDAGFCTDDHVEVGLHLSFNRPGAKVS